MDHYVLMYTMKSYLLILINKQPAKAPGSRPLSSLKQRHLNSRLFILKGMHILKQPIAAADHSRFPAFFFHQGEQMSGIRRRDLVTVSIGTDIALLHPRKMLIQLRIEILPVPIPQRHADAKEHQPVYLRVTAV